MMELSGTTKVCTSLGYPISQSLSPAVQTAAFHAVGLNWVYIAWGVKVEHLPVTIQALRACDNYVGGNVTAPHKIAIVPMLDELTLTATRLQAVNVILRSKGKMVGDNTDGAGFIAALREQQIESKGKRVTVLGAGGAAKAVAFALQDAGVAEIRLVNRTLAHVEALASSLQATGKTRVSVHPLAEAPTRFLEGVDLLVNATSVGLQPDARPLFDYGLLRPPLMVVDLVFFPRETPFLRRAQENGCRTLNGLGMLLHQAALSFQGWTGKAAPLALMRSKFEEALTARERGMR
jgi:shikimate dehydrogenase